MSVGNNFVLVALKIQIFFFLKKSSIQERSLKSRFRSKIKKKGDYILKINKVQRSKNTIEKLREYFFHFNNVFFNFELI